MSQPSDQQGVAQEQPARTKSQDALIAKSAPYDLSADSTSPEARERAKASQYDKLHAPVLLGRLRELGVDTTGLHEKEELVALLERVSPSGAAAKEEPKAKQAETGAPAGAMDF
ncbi:unnamed protein product [Polarella glacialis]|uniref:Uncharacterized protein n=1 Tax=Polarella glacialis TaxID=89957 RepID=A0A813K4L3_POLGL|nr:unnamed protein product [Polarella glacialis]